MTSYMKNTHPSPSEPEETLMTVLGAAGLDLAGRQQYGTKSKPQKDVKKNL
jgi:hypothetical protein